MKRVPLTNSDEFILCDDEDFAELSKHDWRIYRLKKRTIVKAYKWLGVGQDNYIYPSEVMFPSKLGQGITWHYKDGNNLNWQRANILLYSGRLENARSCDSHIYADWCPFGAVRIVPAPYKSDGTIQRSPACVRCDDVYAGSYWKCLQKVKETNWANWRREDDKR